MARATVRHMTVTGEDGAPVNVTQIAEIASPHGHNHPADHARVMADILLEKMKIEVEIDPLSPTGTFIMLNYSAELKSYLHICQFKAKNLKLVYIIAS